MGPTKQTFERRIAKVKDVMADRGIDVLVVPAPANMHYLSGYDGWSFYLDQCLILSLDAPTPLWIGRASDRHAAADSPVIESDDIFVYGDAYLQSDTLHPYEFIAAKIASSGWSRRRIAVPLDDYYFSARALASLRQTLREATIVDDQRLINWVRAIKEPAEIASMQEAGRLAANALRRGAATVRAGNRKADTAAEVLAALAVAGPELTGEYSAIAPLIIDGEGPARPHTTWNDASYQENGATILEIAGVRRRYHCPIARTVGLGTVRQEAADAIAAQSECLRMIEEVTRPGMTCGELAVKCAASLKSHGFVKSGRFGYSTGLAYPPDWGEHTVSVREGEETVICEGMTLFFIPAIWGRDWSAAVGETFCITSAGAERLTDLDYDLIRQ